MKVEEITKNLEDPKLTNVKVFFKLDSDCCPWVLFRSMWNYVPINHNFLAVKWN